MEKEGAWAPLTLSLPECHNLGMRKMVFLALCFAICAAYSSLAAEKDFTPLERQAEAMRGLKWKRAVPTIVLDGAGMRKVLAGQMRKEYSESEWPVMEKTLKAFALIPPKMNLRAVMNGLLEEQVVGLYDPYEKKLYVNSSPSSESELLEGLGLGDLKLNDVYVLHEMVHALTDQHFDLRSMPIADKENEDRASAARAVVEGDATWVMMRFLYDSLNLPPDQRGQLDDLVFGMNAGKELMGTAVPAYLQENLLVAYLGGQTLVKKAYERGGFEGVNRLYRNPPSSMEQVLHPDKYFSMTDPPIKVALATPPAFKAHGWSEIGAGVWGEFNTRIILEEWGIPEEEARKASEGWGGDAYRVFEGPGGSLGLAWGTVWDTDKDASEFFHSAARVKGAAASRDGKKVVLIRGAPAAVKEKAA